MKKINKATLLVSVFVLLANLAFSQHKCGKASTLESYTQKATTLADSLQLTGEKRDKFMVIHTDYFTKKSAVENNEQEVEALKEQKKTALKSLLSAAEYEQYQEKQKEMKEAQKKLCEDSGCKKKKKKPAKQFY